VSGNTPNDDGPRNDDTSAPRTRLPRREQVTIPVDVDEMKAAAVASTRVPDPQEPVPDRIASAANVVLTDSDQLTARLAVAGSAETVSLRIHNLTRSGVSLEVPDDSALLADVGTNVNVQMTLGTGAGTQAVHMLARVAHRRRGDGTRLGGIGLRWDDSAPQTIEKVEQVLAVLGERGDAIDAD
jgi:hypothetical protein